MAAASGAVAGLFGAAKGTAVGSLGGGGGGGAKGLAATPTGGGAEGGTRDDGKRSVNVLKKATTSSTSFSVSAGPEPGARLKGARSRTMLDW